MEQALSVSSTAHPGQEDGGTEPSLAGDSFCDRCKGDAEIRLGGAQLLMGRLDIGGSCISRKSLLVTPDSDSDSYV